MAKKAEQNNKNLIIGICIALIVLAVIAVIVVLVLRNNSPSANDAFFTNDDTKYVLTLNADEFSAENKDYQPVKAHLVYYHSGEAITDMKSFYEYANDKDAKSAYDFYKANYTEEFQSIELDGKYLILTANPADYEGVTAYDVEQQLKFIESINSVDQSTVDEVDVKEQTNEETTVEETTVEETTVEETTVEEVTE